MIESQIELEKAIALDANYVLGFSQLGITLIFLGQPAAALPPIENALRLSLRTQNIWYHYYWLGYGRLLLAETDKAIELLRKCRAANPQIWGSHLLLAAALGLNGDVDEAKLSVADLLKLMPECNSIARLREKALPYMGNPKFVALREQTEFAGLRKADMPEE